MNDTQLSQTSDVSSFSAIEVIQWGSRVFLTSMSPQELQEFTVTPFYDSRLGDGDPRQGYQRPLDESRERQIAAYLDRENREAGRIIQGMPIILSAREHDLRFINGKLTLSPDYKLFVVDGQHRRAGYIRAMTTIPGFDTFQVPVTIIADVTRSDEMRVFNTINTTAKPVRTDLSSRILDILATAGGDLNATESTRVVYAKVVTRLNDDMRSPFRNRISQPDSRKIQKGCTTRSASLMASIKPVDNFFYNRTLDTTLSVAARTEQVSKVLLAAWEGLTQIHSLKAAFLEPEKYLLQSSVGTGALHILITQLLRNVVAPKERTKTLTWKQLFSQSSSLCDPANWHKGLRENGIQLVPRGKYAHYGSQKGFNDLADVLFSEIMSKIQELPEAAELAVA